MFPCFLFTSGISSPPRALPTRKLVRRAGVLVGLGVLVNQIPKLFNPRSFLDVSTIRLPGVLQRTGIASLVASLDAYLPTGVLPAALVGLWYLVSRRFSLTPDRPFVCGAVTAQSRLDVKVFGASHLHQPAERFDPEGLLGSLLTSPVSILLGRLFRQSLIAVNSYVTGLRQPRASMFPPSNPKADVSSLPPLVGRCLPHLAAAGTAIAFAQLTSGVLGRLAPYPTPESKALWTPRFVGRTTAWSIGYWAFSDVLVALTRLDGLHPKLKRLLDGVVDRVETLGRMSLEGYLVSCLGQALLQAGGSSSAWSTARSALEAIGASTSVAGVTVSLAFGFAVVELVGELERRRLVIFKR